MKVLFINRDKAYQGNSVEELFRNIQSSITSLSFDNYYYDNKLSEKENIKKINQYEVDIYHITSGLPQLIKYLPKSKTIFTVHDINRYIHDLKGIRKILYRLYFLNCLKKYNFLTTISENVKIELINHLNIDRNNINVIHNCYPINFSYTHKEFNKNHPRILHIGTKKWKNLDRLIIALNGINCNLIIIGKLNDNTINLLVENNINYENYYNLSFEEVKLQYEKCDIVSFVSLYEGFGMPIIEAQAIGRVVITSNLSSMPEIASNSAHLVNPFSIDDIKKGILKLINDDTFRNDLVEKGRNNVFRFEPKTISQKYVSLYEKIHNQ